MHALAVLLWTVSHVEAPAEAKVAAPAVAVEVVTSVPVIDVSLAMSGGGGEAGGAMSAERSSAVQPTNRPTANRTTTETTTRSTSSALDELATRTDDRGGGTGGAGGGDGGGIGGGHGPGIGLGTGRGISDGTADVQRVALPPPPRASMARKAKLVYPANDHAVTDESELFVARLAIDRDGYVVGAKLVRGRGGRRDEVAQQQIWRFRYAPALDDEGRPVPSTLDQQFLVQ